MKSRIKLGLHIAAILVVASGIISVAQSYFLQGKAVEVTSVTRVSGEEVGIPAIGRKTILVIWQKNCLLCTGVIQKIDSLVQLGMATPDQTIIVNIKDSSQDIIEFVEKNKLNMLVAADTSGRTSGTFNNILQPTVVVIDEKGIVEYATAGPFFRLNKIKTLLQKH